MKTYLNTLIRMKTLYVALAFIFIGLANNFSDNPEENPAQKVEQCNKPTCPKCDTDNCIYDQIEEEISNAGGDGTDQQIYDAASKVFILRNITDSPTMKLILSNYYL